MRVLYVSHNGMLEGLGQSQVLAYLRGLARRGVSVDLLSYELATAQDESIGALRSSLEGSGVRWTPMRRHQNPHLAIKASESVRGIAQALASALVRRPDIVHGRSYLPTAVADVVASAVPGAKLLFDCRGMLGDEYVDAGYWTTERLEYRLLKRYEARAFRRAEGVVVLTEALKKFIQRQGWLGPKTEITAIPCCVDLERFTFDASARRRVRAELGLEGRLVLVYAGTLGSWYREREMARFAKILRERSTTPVACLVLTSSSPDELVSLLRTSGFASDEVVTRKVAPANMPAYLAAGDIGMSFIMSCFSKMGSSPTKVAEYLACGLAVVLNGDIGDQRDLATERDACVVVESFEDAALLDAADRALALAARPMEERVREGRRVADARFGLETVGVTRYERLYEQMTAGVGSPLPIGGPPR